MKYYFQFHNRNIICNSLKKTVSREIVDKGGGGVYLR